MESAGRYQIKDVIGQGGMSTVYRATDPVTRREVAVKVLSELPTPNDVSQQRFEIEAQTIASLEHEAIVPLYDFGESEGRLYMVMRLMHGGSLADRLKEGPLSLPQSIAIVRRLASALEAAHGKGIVHRDLKPANILFDNQGNPFLCDFGIAKLMEGSGTLTGGALIGTPAYMSPEQITNYVDIGPYSDIYSLGVILYEMLTGKLPYEAVAFVVTAMEFEQMPIASIRDTNPSLPEECDRIIARAMKQYAVDRYATVGEMAEELTAAGRPDREKVSAKAPGMSFWLKSRPAFVWGLISLLLVSMAALGLLVSSLTTPERPTYTVTYSPTVAPAPSHVISSFSEDTFGLLILLEEEGGETGRLASTLNGDLRAVLVESGLANRVETDIRAATGLVLEEEASRQKATLAVHIQVKRDASGIDLSASSFLNEQSQPAGFSQYIPVMRATIDTLLAPFSAPDEDQIRQQLTARLAAIINTAAGTFALYDGAYGECSRRFTAVLSLLEQINLSYKRAEASHASLAICLEALGQNEEAREHYEAAVDINPDYSLAYYGLGNYYYSREEYSQAERLYEETIKRSFSDPLSSDEIIGRAYLGLGNLSLLSGDFPAAVTLLDQAIVLMPDFPATYLARAIALSSLGQEALAQTNLDQCLRLATEDEPRQSDYYRQVAKECRSLQEEIAIRATGAPTKKAPATGNATPEQTEESAAQLVLEVTATSASLREGPGTDYFVVDYLLAGERLIIIARDRTGDWYNVKMVNGSTGWIAASVTKFVEGAVEAVPVAATIPALPKGTETATPESDASKPPTAPPPAPTSPPPVPPTSPPPLPTPLPP